MFRHIIWDWNGTLLNDLDACIESMNFILNKRNLEHIDKHKYMSIFNFPVRDYYIKLGFDFQKESFEEVSDDFTEQYSQRCFSCHLHRNAKEVISSISKAGITQSILTAAHQDYIEKCADFYGIKEYFIRLLGLDNTHAHGKIDNGKKLISELPYAPDEIALIGDTLHDYEVAKEIGCQCILVACGHHGEERLRATGAVILSSLDGVLEYILERGKR